jgi:hypothetical protein
MGSTQYHDISAQKYAVQECLRVLQRIGYNIPTYSSMRIGALDVGLHHDIGHYCAQLAENNVNDVVSLITYIQINCYVYIHMHGSDNHIFPNRGRLRRMA